IDESGGVVPADSNTSTIVASIGAGVRANPWRPVRLGLDPAQLHLFEPGSGRRLVSGPVPSSPVPSCPASVPVGAMS
ncbi:MAG: hypothetical protein ABIO83_01885, partial [Ilumatobacteraceae bacterium]